MKREAIERANMIKNQGMEAASAGEWWKDQRVYRPITEWTLHFNEWLDFDQQPEDHPAYQAEKLDESSIKRLAN